MAEAYRNELEEPEHTRWTVTVEEKDALVSELMRYLLFKNHSKNGRPVSHKELCEVVTKRYDNSKPGLPSLIIKFAQLKFVELFGMELCAFRRPTAKEASRARGSAPSERGTLWYCLRSALPDDLQRRLVHGPMDKTAFHGFAATVLACVELCGDEGIPEDELWRMLEMVGVAKGTAHPTLGRPEELLAQMEGMRYIRKEKAAAAENAANVYKIAENAASEIGTQAIQAVVQEVVGEREDA
eukprot:CAMPEP_0177606308 /NCGR_PEP_ID=MMETSP0419_2-20121207/17228_1 /TAXON_ID=582737 /ORGANISM="Tetraselmis sp., Strain GSL018" /LENGTH=240 /DNA_ID=CAMNT_0019100641 /DNA_START=639 /DNA_END=1361 /DNA_ORIENTATION=-